MSTDPTTDPARLRLADLPADPMELLRAWLRRAEASEAIRYPGAWCLSTLSPDGQPEGRFVIVERFAADGLLFATDARSPKARALATTPRGALTVYWGAPLELQIRAEGEVREAPAAVADALFAERPRRSQATAWASRQSAVTTLAALEADLARIDADAPGGRPDHWRAYRLIPTRIEFWAARARRLHDRFSYTRRAKGGWEIHRLAP